MKITWIIIPHPYTLSLGDIPFLANIITVLCKKVALNLAECEIIARTLIPYELNWFKVHKYFSILTQGWFLITNKVIVCFHSKQNNLISLISSTCTSKQKSNLYINAMANKIYYSNKIYHRFISINIMKLLKCFQIYWYHLIVFKQLDFQY